MANREGTIEIDDDYNHPGQPLMPASQRGSNLVQIAILVVLVGIFVAVVVGVATQNKTETASPATTSCSGYLFLNSWLLTLPGFSVKYTPYFSRPAPSKFSLPPGLIIRPQFISHDLGDVFVSNARIWTVDGNNTEILQGNLLIEGGIIIGVGESVHPPDNFHGARIDAAGRYLTPGLLFRCLVLIVVGLVDMHSHLGVYAFPEDSAGTNDGNEATNPTTPQGELHFQFTTF